MAKQLMAAGQTAASTDVIEVGEGERVTIRLFAASKIPAPVKFTIASVGIVGTQDEYELSVNEPSVVIDGRGKYIVVRPNIAASGVDVGVQREDGL